MKTKELDLLLKEGEGLTIEFKEKYTTRIDRDIVALTNAKGGFIILGVNDKGKVVGEKMTNTMKAEILSLARNCDPHIISPKISQIGEVVVIEISEGDEKPYSCSSGYYRRLDAVTQKMSQNEVRTMFRETTDIFFESLPCKDFTLGDVSLNKVKLFLKESKSSLEVGKDNLSSFLSSLSIYKNHNINNTGVLMFAADINRFIPYSEIILAAFKGVDKIHIYDRKDVRDNLFVQLNEAIEFLKKHLNIRSEIHEFDRHDVYEIPLDALREALVNAIVHRDYSMRGTSIYVNIFDDRVEIVNPGGLPAGITKENFGKESVRRNPIIADLFHRMGRVERMGTGIRRIQDLVRNAGLKQPDFTSDTFFHAIFYRNPEYALKHSMEKSSPKSSPKGSPKSSPKSSPKGSPKGSPITEDKIIRLIQENNQITTAIMGTNLGISKRAILKQVDKLKKKGFLKHIGPAKGGHWEVLK